MGTQQVLSLSESKVPATHPDLKLLWKQNNGHFALRLTSSETLKTEGNSSFKASECTGNSGYKENPN